jgi:hypothetical protein
MAQYKKEETEDTQQKEGIENLRRFCSSIIPHLAICPVSVIQREKGLNYPGHPPESNQSGKEHEHFPLPDLLN